MNQIHRGMPLHEMVIAIHQTLFDRDIAHSFSGGLALAFHIANPRTTNDIDIALNVPSIQAKEVFHSLPLGIKWNERLLRLAEVQGSVRLTWFRGIKVDLFFRCRDYDDIVNTRSELKRFAGIDIPIVAATDLAILKSTFDRGSDIAGKERDWTDIRLMLEAQTVDVKESLKWVAHLSGSESANYQKLATLVSQCNS